MGAETVEIRLMEDRIEVPLVIATGTQIELVNASDTEQTVLLRRAASAGDATGTGQTSTPAAGTPTPGDDDEGGELDEPVELTLEPGERETLPFNLTAGVYELVPQLAETAAGAGEQQVEVVIRFMVRGESAAEDEGGTDEDEQEPEATPSPTP
jgi:hypothetical protein